jgi:hypothetical protein
MIASFIAVMPTRPAQRQMPRIEQMSEIVTVRRHLSDQKIAAENATRLLEDATLQRLSRGRIAQLASDIAELDNHFDQRVGYRAVGALRRPARWSAQATSSRTIALRVVIILRITATIVTFGTLPAVVRRWRKALSVGFQFPALMAAM